MTNKEKLEQICEQKLAEKNLDEEYQQRLKDELWEINAQNEHDYFLELYDEGAKFSQNENNLLIPHLLGLTDEFSISEPPFYEYGDFPDIDTDFLPAVRDYLKNEWAPKQFGQDYVANIGSYNTYGIKSALIDMARIFGKDRYEILALTTKIGLKDDEGNVLVWDKALELHSDLKEYCDRNPDVADAAKKLINRNRSMGKHAGGLIISNQKIHNFVPLVKGKEGDVVSAWTEGLHDQDLGPVGFIKFDLLVLTNLEQIALACKLIKERHNNISICALEGQEDWSDDSFLNDKEALKVANDGDLKCIFQFDSEGIRQLVKKGGVDNFNDLVAYAALYRPGPMDMGMHDHYIERKRGREKYDLHPHLKPILEKTYGVMSYQEQIIKILHIVGAIPQKDCEILRKAISKKKEEYFEKYKEQFVVNGQKVLEWEREQAEELWKQIEAFSGYGFNLAHATCYTYISCQLLWLKAHYPLEFFAAILAFENVADKLKDYRLEAEKHNIVVHAIDVNKSGVKCHIVDDSIYFGLANLKGIGENVAQEIVNNQPYSSFNNFLHKFGTDASVLKPLMGLKIFKDADPITLYKYSEWYKKAKKKKIETKKRYETTSARIKQDIQELIGCPLSEWNGQLDEEKMVEFEKLKNKFRKCTETFSLKRVDDPLPDLNEVPLDDDSLFQFKFDDKLMKILSSDEDSERQFYGFLWNHPLQKCPEYQGGLTFENLKEKDTRGYVEFLVNAVTRTVSKKKTVYWLIKAEDANSEEGLIQVWEDDWDRFKDEFHEGALLRAEISKPQYGFRRFTLYSPPRHKRHELPKNKSVDFRVVVLKKEESDA